MSEILDGSDVADEDRLDEPVRIGTLSRSLMSVTVAFVGTIGIRSPIRTLPEGESVFAALSAVTTSSGDML